MSGGIGEVEGTIIDIGPGRMERIPFPAFNELTQVRTAYDEEGIRELAGAIYAETSGEVSSDTFKLLSPPAAGLFTRQEAATYITEHGEFYEIPTKDRVDPQDLTPYDDDRAIILIAGHRRKRAVRYLLGQLGVEPERVRLLTAVHPGIEFADAVVLQLRENTYEKPPAWDEARAIELSYRRQQALTGAAPNIRELARYLGYSETKVRDALQFVSLPKSVQEFARGGILSYTSVRGLYPLYAVYQEKYKHLPEAARIAAATAEVENFCNIDICKYLEGKKDDRIGVLIVNKIAALRKEIAAAGGDYSQEELFFMDMSPEVRVRQSRHQMATLAFRVMQHSVPEYTPEQLADMQRAIAIELEKRTRLAEQENTPPLFEAT